MGVPPVSTFTSSATALPAGMCSRSSGRRCTPGRAQLLRPRGLARHAKLGEARDPRLHDQPLPVLRDLLAELLEEGRADRPGPTIGHVAPEHVPELGHLVQVREAQYPPDARHLRPAVRRVSSCPRYGPSRASASGLERPELVHREDAAGACRRNGLGRDAGPRELIRIESAIAAAIGDKDDGGRTRDRDVERPLSDIHAPRRDSLMRHVRVASASDFRAGVPRSTAGGRPGRQQGAAPHAPASRDAPGAACGAHSTAPSIMSTSSAGSRRTGTPSPVALDERHAREGR